MEIKNPFPKNRKVGVNVRHFFKVMPDYVKKYNESPFKICEDFKVRYDFQINNVKNSFLSQACFAEVFNKFSKPKPGDYINVNLMYHQTCVYASYGDNKITDFKNVPRMKLPMPYLRQYISHLNQLYSGIRISIRWRMEQNYPHLYAVVKFKKKYPNVVLRDILTRIRYTFEEPFATPLLCYMLQNNFSLQGYDQYMKDLLSCKRWKNEYIPVGHYLYNNPRKNDVMDYQDYEQRVLELLKENPELDLHRLTYKLIPKNESI